MRLLWLAELAIGYYDRFLPLGTTEPGGTIEDHAI
jgi:hypothetical protein